MRTTRLLPRTERCRLVPKAELRRATGASFEGNPGRMQRLRCRADVEPRLEDRNAGGTGCGMVTGCAGMGPDGEREALRESGGGVG